MSSEQLKASLQNLHEHLNATEHVDAETVQLLVALNQDIQHLLSRDRPDEDSLMHLGDRTLELSAKLAAQSPHLESGLRELGNILLRMGV